MSEPTLSIQELRDDVVNYRDIELLETTAVEIIDRLEAAEARIPELQQLMAQGHSKARKHGLQRDALSRELYRTQMILEGVSADYGDSPMAIQARPPVDDVSRLLDERLKRDAARIGELEAAQKPRPMADAPRDGSPLIVMRESSWWGRMADGVDVWSCGRTTGWLPLPDQSKDTP